MNFVPDQKVKVKRSSGDMQDEDFGASGLVIETNLKRFGPWLNDVMYYFGEIKEFPEWCVIGTSKIVTNSTKHFAIRKDNVEPVPDENI